MIDFFTPNANHDQLVERYRLIFEQKGIDQDQRLAVILQSFYDNAALFSDRGIDYWLGFGAYLPAVERVIAMTGGESETAFYRRTQYPKQVVDAYSVFDGYGAYDDFAILVIADDYRKQHLGIIPANTSVWQISTDGDVINLNDYGARLNGLDPIKSN